MSGTNIVIEVGRLVRDPELKEIRGSSLATFTIANNYVYTSNGEKKEEALFLDCIVWGKMAEAVVAKYCKKGKQVAVSGRLRLNSWQAEDGSKRSKHELVVGKLELLGGQSEGNKNKPPDSNYEPPDHVEKQYEGSQDTNPSAGECSQDLDESDIPF